MNMKSVWNFGSVSAVLFITTRLCGELRRQLATQIGHQSLNGTCVSVCAILTASVGGPGVRSILSFSFHQKFQAVPLDPHRRLLVDHQLKLLEPHISRLHRCRRLPNPRHLSRSLQPMQVGMTIVRCEIHSLVSKNDAVIIMIEDDCDATMLQFRSAQEKFAHVHHAKCELDSNSSATVRHHVSVTHFLSVVL